MDYILYFLSNLHKFPFKNEIEKNENFKVFTNNFLKFSDNFHQD